MSVESFDKMVETIRQMQNHEGPHYEKWLKNYRKAVTERCPGIAEQYRHKGDKWTSRWLAGMKIFLMEQEGDKK